MKRNKKITFPTAEEKTFHIPKHFAGSFSGKGFTNYLPNALEGIEKLYIIKGTAGSGKSTLMKKVAHAAEESGETVERIYCSSDTSSLDGVVIPSRSFAIVDGTAPHVLEPSYPLARETIINTGDYIDLAEIERHKENIIHHSDKKKSLFRKAEMLLKSFSVLETLKMSILEECYDSKRSHDLALKIISAEPNAKSAEPEVIKRSLVSFSKNGITNFFDSLDTRKIYKTDEYFAPFFLGTLKLLSEEYKANAVFSPSPFDPSQICAIHFPSTKRLFADSRFFEPSAEKEMTNVVNLQRNQFSSEQPLKENREKLNFIKKTEKHVLNEAREYLCEAMEHHSILESIYVQGLNKSALDCLAQSLIVSLFK